MIRSVQRISKRRQLANDLAFWLSRPMAERVAAVEVLRMQMAPPANPPMLNRDFKEFAELNSRAPR